MKKVFFTIITIFTLSFLSSCGVNHAFLFNHNQNSTQVQLGSNNFKVVDQVSGSSKVSYVLAIGGVNKKQLFKDAYSEMVKSANLAGPKALINVVTEEHLGGLPPIFYTRTVTVSAHVIEFTN